MEKQIAKRSQTIQAPARPAREGQMAVRPATDIIEMEDGFHIVMDMPGVDKESLAIDLENNQLVVSARSDYQAAPTGDNGRRLHHHEFGDAEYRRSFTVSDAVDRSGITARLDNGVVDLFLPKSERLLPKRIEVRAG